MMRKHEVLPLQTSNRFCILNTEVLTDNQIIKVSKSSKLVRFFLPLID